MTPEERELMKREIAAAVAVATTQLRAKIEMLEGVDKAQHARQSAQSGAIKGIIPEVRKSVSEIKLESETELAAAVRVLDAKMDAQHAETNKKLSFLNVNTVELPQQATAAATAATAANQKATAAASAAIDAEAAVQASKKDSRWRTVALMISIIVSAVISHFLKG